MFLFIYIYFYVFVKIERNAKRDNLKKHKKVYFVTIERDVLITMTLLTLFSNRHH